MAADDGQRAPVPDVAGRGRRSADAGVPGGGTQLKYQLRAIDDLAAWLKGRATGCRWAARTSRSRRPRARSRRGADRSNPVGGWYGMKKGLRGRFGVYMPPLLEAWAWPRSSTTRRTTGCGRSDRAPVDDQLGADQVGDDSPSMPRRGPCRPSARNPDRHLADHRSTDPRAITLLTTEHWSLLTSRSLAYNEAFTRGGMFLTFLSMSFVALALFAQAMSFGEPS